MATLICPSCSQALPSPGEGGSRLVTCVKCGRETLVHIFPAFWRQSDSVHSPGGLLSSDECACYYHPAKPASHACANCGRFICQLCEVMIGDRLLCPKCVSSRAQNKSPEMESSRFLYDNLALVLAVLPIFTIWLTLITAPAALFVCIRYSNMPCSLVRRSRWRFLVAFLAALAQVVGWGILIVFLVAL